MAEHWNSTQSLIEWLEGGFTCAPWNALKHGGFGFTDSIASVFWKLLWWLPTRLIWWAKLDLIRPKKQQNIWECPNISQNFSINYLRARISWWRSTGTQHRALLSDWRAKLTCSPWNPLFHTNLSFTLFLLDCLWSFLKYSVNCHFCCHFDASLYCIFLNIWL